MKYEVTDTTPQDMQRRTLRNPMQFKLRQSRPAEQEILQAAHETIRGYLAQLGGLNRGRLTACGTVSTGGGGVGVAFTGRSLIPGGWRQSRVTATQTLDADSTIIWEVIAPGIEGDGITVEYVQDGGATAVTWVAGTRTIHCHIDIAGAAITAAAVVAALAADATASHIVQARYPGAGVGAGHIRTAGSWVTAGGAGTAMTRALLTFADGANSDLEYEAIDYGPDAKAITVAYVHDAGAVLPSVAVTDGATTVAIAVTANIGVATALEIRQAVRDSAAAMAWVHVRLADGSSGVGTPAAHAATALAAPFGTDGFNARIGGIVASIETLTDDGGTFDCAAGVGGAGTTAELVICIGGIEHRIAAPVVA